MSTEPFFENVGHGSYHLMASDGTPESYWYLGELTLRESGTWVFMPAANVEPFEMDPSNFGFPDRATTATPICEPLLPPPMIDHGPKLGERQHFRFPAPPPKQR